MKEKVFLMGFVLITLSFLLPQELVQTRAQPYVVPFWNYQVEDQVNAVSISSDGKYIAMGSWDNNVYLFNIFGELIWQYKTISAVDSVALSADGSYIVAGSSNIFLFNNSGDQMWNYRAEYHVTSVSISTDGSYIAAGSLDSNIYLFNNSGDLLWKYKAEDWINCVTISADGNYIAVGSKDNNVYFFSNTGDLIWDYETGNDVTSVSISADGSYVVVGSKDHHIYLFRNSGDLTWKYTANNIVTSVSITPDGSHVAAGSSDVFFFSNLGELIWKNEEISASSVSITPNGSHVATGSNDDNIYLLNRSGEICWSYESGGDVNGIYISSDGNHVVAGSEDNNIYLFLSFPSLFIPCWSQNEVTGSFEGAHDCPFDVIGTASHAYLKICISYHMTVDERYLIQVQILDSTDLMVDNRSMVIVSTTAMAKTEYARTVVRVKSPGNYTIRFLPEGVKKVSYSIVQSEFDNCPTITPVTTTKPTSTPSWSFPMALAMIFTAITFRKIKRRLKKHF